MCPIPILRHWAPLALASPAWLPGPRAPASRASRGTCGLWPSTEWTSASRRELRVVARPHGVHDASLQLLGYDYVYNILIKVYTTSRPKFHKGTPCRVFKLHEQVSNLDVTTSNADL